MYEEGDGSQSPWGEMCKMNRVGYQHSINERLYEEDRLNYAQNIAITGPNGYRAD